MKLEPADEKALDTVKGKMAEVKALWVNIGAVFDKIEKIKEVLIQVVD